MGKLTENLKRALEGLAHQDAAEYLTTSQKMEVLGIEPLHTLATSFGASSRRSESGGAGRRIALVSGGGSAAPALDFALSACRRHAAELDLVSLGASPGEEAGLAKLIGVARQSETLVSQVHLPQGGSEALRAYVCGHPSLIYLVATVVDDLACELTERILRTAGVNVPLVLVGGHAPMKSSSLYAA